jgi:hypothetical protein
MERLENPSFTARTRFTWAVPRLACAPPAQILTGKGSVGGAYAHERNVRVYLTCNTYPPTRTGPTADFLRMARDAGADALIVADVGILKLAKGSYRNWNCIFPHRRVL